MSARNGTRLSKGTVHGLTKTRPRPRPPLDFLYPRWFSEARLTRPSLKRDSVPHEAGDGNALAHEQSVTTTRRCSERWLDHNDRQQRPSQALWRQYTADQHWVAETKRELDTIRRRKDPAQVIEKELQRAGKHVNEQQHTGGRRSVRIRRYSPVAVRRLKTNGSGTASPMALSKLLKVARYKPGETSWSVAAKTLEGAMQWASVREGEEILLHERVIVSLTGTTHRNTWINPARGGCEVEVLSRSQGSGGKRRIILRGSHTAREITKEYFLSLEASLNTSNHDAARQTNVPTEGLTRWMASRGRLDPDLRDAIRADQLPLPETWSVRSFAQHIEDLCTMRLTRATQRELYPFEETIQQNVAAVLENLFTKDELVPYLSSYAFQVALQYTCEHTQLGSTSELLYAKAKQLGLHRQIWTFNIMIERALTQNEPNALGDIVKDMRAAEVVPNGLTWSKLLLITDSTFVRRHILDFVLRVYPDDFSAAMEYLTCSLMDREMQKMVRGKDGFETFVQLMDSAYGPDWLTSRTLSVALAVCSHHELWKAGHGFVQLVSERGVSMSSDSVKAMVQFYCRQGDLNKSIDLLDSPWVRELGYDSDHVIPSLFLGAWRRQRWNMCRVLWQYAASRGLINYGMQMRVYSSLGRNQNLAVLPPYGSFENLAGKLVVGTDLKTTNLDEQFPRLSKYFSTTKDPIQWLAQWTPNNGIREEQLSLAYVVLQRDLAAWKVLKPVPKNELPGLLSAARKRDQAWVAQKFDKHATLAELLANVMQIPLVPSEHQEPLQDGEGDSAARYWADPKTLVDWKPIHNHIVKMSSKVVMSSRIMLVLSLAVPKLLDLLHAVSQKPGRFRATTLSTHQFLAQWVGPRPGQVVA